MTLLAGLMAALSISSISPERLQIYILGGLIGVFVAALIAWAKTGAKTHGDREYLKYRIKRL